MPIKPDFHKKARIFERAINGETLESIGAHMGLSKSHVGHQIPWFQRVLTRDKYAVDGEEGWPICLDLKELREHKKHWLARLKKWKELNPET